MLHAPLRFLPEDARLRAAYADPAPDTADGRAVYREPPEGAGLTERSKAFFLLNRHRLGAVLAASMGDFERRGRGGPATPACACTATPGGCWPWPAARPGTAGRGRTARCTCCACAGSRRGPRTPGALRRWSGRSSERAPSSCAAGRGGLGDDPSASRGCHGVAPPPGLAPGRLRGARGGGPAGGPRLAGGGGRPRPPDRPGRGPPPGGAGDAPGRRAAPRGGGGALAGGARPGRRDDRPASARARRGPPPATRTVTRGGRANARSARPRERPGRDPRAATRRARRAARPPGGPILPPA